MRSEFCEFLDQMQLIADKENIVVWARHYDVLDFYFKEGQNPHEAFSDYKEFLKRWNALTDNGKNTEAT